MGIEDKTYEVAMAGYRSALRRQEVAWADANDNGDLEAATQASMEAARIDLEMQNFHRRAQQHAASLRPQAPQDARSTSKIFRMTDKAAVAAAERLTDDEIEHAAASGVSEMEYAKNKEYLRWLNATGQRREGPLPHIISTEDQK
jgi:hypothetical protein